MRLLAEVATAYLACTITVGSTVATIIIESAAGSSQSSTVTGRAASWQGACHSVASGSAMANLEGSSSLAVK